ncbi:hypothetical protein SAMN04515665_103132 [Blastococcus sp. DSM 46786]|uniref:hypothetical protein n=1 Tax=Blastococcus sp. DSM 46786 TaxID=1798227 RepID=UPI0008D11A04|nr:hypothetical protein [Blastococcus sp. DSM 46786]SEK59521.1 hypothetical protein SAMN04515665_103132 [Blastococcus sp. DSM 46786]
MTDAISLRIQDLILETDLAGPDLAALEARIEAALSEVARLLQVRLSGRSGPSRLLVLPDLVIDGPALTRLVAGPGVDALAAAVLAQVDARLRSAS